MAHSFDIEVGNVAAALEKAKRAIDAEGGDLDGDTSSGTFSGKGVYGSYSAVSGGKVRVTITKKPFYAPDGIIESKVREFFA